MKYKINMLSTADTVKGQGVLSAYNEQVNLIREGLGDKFEVFENKVMIPDIAHYHTISLRFFLSLPFMRMKAKTVGYVHFLPETLENSIHLNPISKTAFYGYVIRFYKSMDYLVTVNPLFVERLADLGIDRNKIRYIPNFVCDKLFYPIDDADKPSLRKQHGLPVDKFTVICAGQLQKRKGIFDFIEVAKKLPDMQFIWAGGFSFGSLSDGYAEIKESVASAPKNILFPGIVDREQMNLYYNMSDCLLLASFDELFPMTILESMNCHLPILLRDIDVYRDILNGYYISESDVDGFCSRLVQLRDDPDYYSRVRQMSIKGHEFYCRDRVLRMWDEFYTEIASTEITK